MAAGRQRVGFWIACSFVAHAAVVGAIAAWSPTEKRPDRSPETMAFDVEVREVESRPSSAPEATTSSGGTISTGGATRGAERNRARGRDARPAATGGAWIDPFAIDGVATPHAEPHAEPRTATGAVGVPGEPAGGAGTGAGNRSPLDGRGRGDGGSTELTGVDAREIWRAVQSKARYPRVAASMGIEGRVTVRFRVDAHGRPREIRLIESVGEPLDGAAIAAVEAAAPFTSPEGWVRVPIEFSLRSSP